VPFCSRVESFEENCQCSPQPRAQCGRDIYQWIRM
jgi:hypothetical protein